jgi:hypothetical protein
MEEVKTNAGQGLGIAGLILGLVAIPLAILGCTSVLGLILGSTGIVLSAVGLSQATRSNGGKGLPVGALVVSIFGTCIAILWLLFFAKVATEGGKWWSREGGRIIEEIQKDIGEGMDEKFEDMDEKMDTFSGALEEKLEDLEYGMEWEKKWGKEITEDEFQNVLDTYESLIKDYVNLVNKANKGDITALSEYVKVSAKAVALATKITAISPRLTDEQRQRFEDLQKKYKKALEESEKQQQAESKE